MLPCERCRAAHSKLVACDYCDTFVCAACRTGRTCTPCLRAKAVTLTPRAERIKRSGADDAQRPSVPARAAETDKWIREIFGK